MRSEHGEAGPECLTPGDRHTGRRQQAKHFEPPTAGECGLVRLCKALAADGGLHPPGGVSWGAPGASGRVLRKLRGDSGKGATSRLLWHLRQVREAQTNHHSGPGGRPLKLREGQR